MAKQKLSKRKKTETKVGVGKKVREHVGYLVELNKLQTTLLLTLSSMVEKVQKQQKRKHGQDARATKNAFVTG